MLILFLLLSGSAGLPQADNLPPSRVISLVPAVTEIIYALGAQDKLVGVATPCDYPPGINVPIVGNFAVPNMERIVALSPDIVFVTGGAQKYLWDKLKALNINIFISDPKNLEETYKSIIDIGKLLAKEEKADSVVQEMKAEFLSFRAEIQHMQKRTVFIEVSDVPLITCGSKSFIDELITLAGGVNIAGSIKQEYPVVSSEFVVKKNPDIIIVLHPGSSPKDRLGWQDIKAVKDGQIYEDIDPDILERPGPRIIQGIKALEQSIYPELFNRKN